MPQSAFLTQSHEKCVYENEPFHPNTVNIDAMSPDVARNLGESSDLRGDAGSRLRVSIVKRDRFFAESVKLMAMEVFPSCAVEIFHSGAAAIAGFRDQPSDLAVFGLSLPDVDGLDLLAYATGNKLVRKCLIVSGRRDERSRSLLRNLGAYGYVDTDTAGVEVLRFALREAGQGRRYFSPPAQSGAGVSTTSPALDRQLSPTELQVFAIIGDGSDDQDGAHRLGMAIGTVHKHRQRIMHKLGIQTRTDLMRMAIQRGIVRFTCHGVLRPGFERQLKERAERSRHPFGVETKPSK